MDNNKFEIEVLTRLTKIETMLVDFKSIEQKSDEAFNLSLSNKKEIEKLQDSNKWLTRTIVASVIGLVIKLIWDLIKIS